ncbi:MAG TPA: RNA polymerase sigma factor [Acidimicrobiia bacterium]|nr:RNA polymerase sigma factor [Acidimicrobiia bacterium]
MQAVRAALHAQDDDALLARLRAGDELAFGALVDRHRAWLVRLCTRLLGYDAHAAEDAAQESLLKLHAAARRSARPLRVRPWLTAVARTTCVDLQRRRRPDLPGELPERAAPDEDADALDAALAAAWSRLSGRHREALYLREVLGFSYKEIGSVMELSMAATETLVFRARAALRREYERCGGSAAGYGVLGLRLARLGLGRRRADAGVADGVADGVSRAALNDGGFGGFGNVGNFGGFGGRLAQWASALPGCSEQAAAKALSIAAGVAVAAAAVLPGLGPLADAPSAAAAAAPLAATATAAAPAGGSSTAPAAGQTGTLKGWLGNAAPAGWEPHRTRPATTLSIAAPPSAAGAAPRPLAPVREAAAAARPADRPTLPRPAHGDPGSGPLRSVLPTRPASSDGGRPPAHPLRALLADPPAVPVPALPVDPPAQPVEPPAVAIPPPVEVPPVAPGSAPATPPEITDAVATVKGFLPLG